jgi:hypothetical protein
MNAMKKDVPGAMREPCRSAGYGARLCTMNLQFGRL